MHNEGRILEECILEQCIVHCALCISPCSAAGRSLRLERRDDRVDSIDVLEPGSDTAGSADIAADLPAGPVGPRAVGRQAIARTVRVADGDATEVLHD